MGMTVVSCMLSLWLFQGVCLFDYASRDNLKRCYIIKIWRECSILGFVSELVSWSLSVWLCFQRPFEEMRNHQGMERMQHLGLCLWTCFIKFVCLTMLPETIWSDETSSKIGEHEASWALSLSLFHGVSLCQSSGLVLIERSPTKKQAYWNGWTKKELEAQSKIWKKGENSYHIELPEPRPSC